MAAADETAWDAEACIRALRVAVDEAAQAADELIKRTAPEAAVARRVGDGGDSDGGDGGGDGCVGGGDGCGDDCSGDGELADGCAGASAVRAADELVDRTEPSAVAAMALAPVSTMSGCTGSVAESQAGAAPLGVAASSAAAAMAMVADGVVTGCVVSHVAMAAPARWLAPALCVVRWLTSGTGDLVADWVCSVAGGTGTV